MISFSLVLGTVLLSNDMQHLRRLSDYFDLPFFKQPQPAVRPPGPQAKRSERSRPVAIKLPAQMLEEPRIQLAGAFLNTWHVPAQDLCQGLTEAGAVMSAFKPSAYSDTNYECTYEKIYRRENDLPASSLFLVIRGDPKGELVNIRLKLVKPPLDSNEQLDRSVLDLITVLLTKLRSSSCETPIDAIARLRDIKTDCFGTGISFVQEIMHPGSFNLVLTPRVAPGAESRTKAFFDAGAWLKAPDPTPATPPDPTPATPPGPGPDPAPTSPPAPPPRPG